MLVSAPARPPTAAKNLACYSRLLALSHRLKVDDFTFLSLTRSLPALVCKRNECVCVGVCVGVWVCVYAAGGLYESG